MTPSSVSPLDQHVSFWMRAVSNQVSHALDLSMQSCGVTVAEWSVLRLLYDNPDRPGRIAARLGLTRSAVSKLADRLEAKALIARAGSGGDQRAHTLKLTDSGRALLPKLAAIADANDEAFFGHLGIEHRETMRLLMRNIIARMKARQKGE